MRPTVAKRVHTMPVADWSSTCYVIIHEKSSITNVGVGWWVVGGAKRHTWLRGLAKAFEMLEESQAHTHTIWTTAAQRQPMT